MIAAIYARKSNEQPGVADEGKSVTRQVAGARAFIAARNWTLDEAHIYTDDGVSGALFANRPEFQRMMRDAEAGAFQAVVFYDLDRFGRNARQTMLALNTLADLGVTVWDYSTGIPVDLESFDGELITFFKARSNQQYRDQVRKHTRAAMRQKAEAGFVTGCKVFGYDNRSIAKGQTMRVPNEAEAAVVRSIYERFAAGEGLRTIALALNRAAALPPRSQQGRPKGWSSSTVRAILERPLYRGEVIFGKTAKAYGRELGKKSGREKGQIKKDEATWIRREAPDLRIIDAELAARVDARRQNRRERYVASLAKGGRVPERAHGKYLLSGGLLVCPTCGGHFEALKSPWKNDGGIYVCATRRRKPGVCSNSLSLPMTETDETVLSLIEGEVLGTRFIDELLTIVDRGQEDDSARLLADRDRLRKEIGNLLDLVASGVSAETLAPKVREREAEVARLDAVLRTPRPARPDIDKLREALLQRAEQWKADLRDEPAVARMLLRRLVGPLTLWDAAEPETAWVEWEASATPALLDGLVHDVASPEGFEPSLPA